MESPPSTLRRPEPAPDEASPAANGRRRRLAGRVAALLVLAAVAAFGVARLRPGEDPEALWTQAQAALHAARFDEARASLERLTARRAPLDRDWVLRAQVAQALNDHAVALDALARVPDSSPLAAEARRMAGQLELRRKRARFAERYLLEALRLDPGQDQARRELVYLYGMQLRREALAEQFLELSRRGPLTYDDIFLWCLVRSTDWEAEEQSADLRAFLDADPDDRWSRLALADSLETLGRLHEAEGVLEPLPRDDPEARARRARLAMGRGDLNAAERLLAVDGSEDHAATAQLRGQLALRRRDAEAALRHFRDAERLNPDDRETLFGLARAYSLAGEAERAQPYLEAGARLDALSTLVQYASTAEGRRDAGLPLRIGKACEDAGRLAEARAWYALAVGRDPLDREAQQALYRLDSASGSAASADTPPPGP